MRPRSGDLVGCWQLAAFAATDAAGRTAPGPLGAAPGGFLFYTASGHLSVAMMRTVPDESAATAYMGYAGRWRIDDGVLYHSILVCSRPD